MTTLVVLVGKSSTGKTTVQDKILKARPDISKVIQFTTRDKRPKEKDGVDYFFVKELPPVHSHDIISHEIFPCIDGNKDYVLYNQAINYGREYNIMVGTIGILEALKEYIKRYNLEKQLMVKSVCLKLDEYERLKRNDRRIKSYSNNETYVETCIRYQEAKRRAEDENKLWDRYKDYKFDLIVDSYNTDKASDFIIYKLLGDDRYE